MAILVIAVNFTMDEAEFLTSLLSRWSESAQPGSAERFWVERLHNRVHQEVVDVVAADSAARLAASSLPTGFPTLPPGGLPGAPTPPAPAPIAFCTCGHFPGSQACHRRRNAGTHP